MGFSFGVNKAARSQLEPFDTLLKTSKRPKWPRRLVHQHFAIAAGTLNVGDGRKTAVSEWAVLDEC